MTQKMVQRFIMVKLMSAKLMHLKILKRKYFYKKIATIPVISPPTIVALSFIFPFSDTACITAKSLPSPELSGRGWNGSPEP